MLFWTDDFDQELMDRKEILFFHKRALITGASSGLGATFAEMLRAESVAVHGTSRNIENFKDEDNLQWLELDLLKEDSVKRLIDRIHRGELNIDLLINNAGAGIMYPVEELSESDMDSQIDLLLRNQIKITQAAYSRMKHMGFGTIVNVSSLAGELPIPYMSLYNACKAGLSVFTQSLMLESKDLRFIDLKPGDYNTGFKIKHNESSRIDVQRSYESMRENVKVSPKGDHCAQYLRKLLLARVSGSYRVGSLAQSRVLPILAKFAPQKIKRWGIQKYFGLD